MRLPLREPLRLTAAISGSLFVGLNVADALLTERLLAIGGAEANRMSIFYGGLASGAYGYSLVIVKGFLALVIVVALVWFGKSKLLWLLNIGISVVVLLNGLCFLSYLAGLYGWL